jgi:nickel-dependent lactate racemase
VEDYFLTGYGGSKVFFQLPDTWQVANNAVLTLEKTERSIYELISESIANPVDTLPLADLVKGKDRIVIIVDDLARPTPKKTILTCLIDHLHEYGVRNAQIDVLIGLGTHRPLTQPEIEDTFGEQLSKEIRFVNHDCHSHDLVSIGTLRFGGNLKVHPLAVKADLRIAIGSILPHPFAGFGGGAKLVLPGIADYEFIRKHHMALMAAQGVSLGNTVENPFYNEILEAARLAKLNFIVNAVYDAREEVKAVVAGHFETAHEMGFRMCAKELGVHFDQAADVTICSAFPYAEGPQVLKPVGIATLVTKKGGTVIIYAPEIKGGRFPAPFLEAFDRAFSICRGDARQLVFDHLRDGIPIVPNAPMDFNAALNTALLFLSRVRILLVSKDADERQAARLGFGHAGSLEEAIEQVSMDIPRAAVNILPSGGLTLPLVAEEMRFEW